MKTRKKENTSTLSKKRSAHAAKPKKKIGGMERGLVLYLRQEGRGIGLTNKIRAYALQDQGLDTVEANISLGLPVDGREWQDAIDILETLGVREFTLLTNNPEKATQLTAAGFDVEIETLEVSIKPANKRYLQTKAERLGHLRKVE